MRRRLTRRQKNKRNKQIIMVSTICLLIVMGVGYAAFQTNLSIIAKGNIKEKSRVIQAWGQTSQTDFHSNFYKQNIVSATFLDNNNVCPFRSKVLFKGFTMTSWYFNVSS